jgi:hypothetical protein
MTSGTRTIFTPEPATPVCRCLYITINRTMADPSESTAIMFKSVFMMWSVTPSILCSAGRRETTMAPGLRYIRPRGNTVADCAKSPIAQWIKRVLIGRDRNSA